MKKIGIVTLQGNFNYGNRLQNYALEQVLLTFCDEVETIVFDTKKQRKSITINRILKKIKRTLNGDNKKGAMMVAAKSKILLPFSHDYLHEKNLNLINIKDFTAFFVGSDQVWNPSYINNDSRFFLSFAPAKRRFSYAASFGVSKIPENMISKYKYYLDNFSKISVRETRGIDLVKEISGSRAVLVADPTLLIDYKKWNNLATESNFLKRNKYILVYMIGEITPVIKEYIKKYANSQNLEILTIMGDSYSEDYWIPTPFEFIAAIRDAEAVFTDSFHGTVFSIIFHTPFITLNRSDVQMVSRIDTLLSMFNLESNKISNIESVEKILADTNFSKVDEVLETNKISGYQYIESCLNSTEEEDENHG